MQGLVVPFCSRETEWRSGPAFQDHFENQALRPPRPESSTFGGADFLLSGNTQDRQGQDEQMIAQKKYKLSQFAPRELLQSLVSDRVALSLGSMKRKEMTIFFSDIRAFTTISERLAPEMVFRYLNAFFKVAAPVIRKHGGIVDKYIGDAILAIFDDPERAIFASVAIQQRLIAFNRRLQKIRLPKIEMGIGIHTGEVMIGILGERKRMDATVISDAVNVASRLQDLNKIYGSNILISDSTFLRLDKSARRAFKFRYLDMVQAKGKKSTTRVYEFYDNYSQDTIGKRARTKAEFEQGVHYFHEKQYENAARNFLEVIKHDPNDRVAVFYLHRTAHFLATNYSLVNIQPHRFFEWEDQYSVGVRGIDDQHKKLFDIINDLHWAKNNSGGRKFIAEILNRLMVYAMAHFSVEGEIMLRHGYSNYAKHVAAHEGFIEKVEQFIREYNSGTVDISEEILSFLVKWLRVHTTGEDRAMAAELNINEEEENF